MFLNKEILIQSPGEPREQHLGAVSPKSSSYTKWPEGSMYAFTSFMVNLSENFPKIYFFGSCYFNFNYFCSFLKNAPDFIDPSGNFVFHEIFCSTNFENSFFSSIVEKLNITTIYKSIILFFQWIFLWYLSTSFVKKKSNPTIRRTSRTTSRWIST